MLKFAKAPKKKTALWNIRLPSLDHQNLGIDSRWMLYFIEILAIKISSFFKLNFNLPYNYYSGVLPLINLCSKLLAPYLGIESSDVVATLRNSICWVDKSILAN